MIRLIAIDLDGTSLLDEFTFHPYNVEIIKKYKELGYKFLIATGRPYRSSKKFYDELGLTLPIINYNGSYIHDTKESDFKTIIYTVKKEDVKQIETDLSEYLCNIMCEYEDLVYIHENDEWIDDFFWKDDIKIAKEVIYEEKSTKLYISITDVIWHDADDSSNCFCRQRRNTESTTSPSPA